MTVSKIHAALPADVWRVWDVVTDVRCYPDWRSGLSRVEVQDEAVFVEYTQNGYATKFTITETNPGRRWAFTIDNSHMTGRWVGIFRQVGAGTVVTFAEYVTAKKLVLLQF